MCENDVSGGRHLMWHRDVPGRARALCLVPGRGSSVADRDAPALSR